MDTKLSEKYIDMLYMEHHVSKKHPPMSIHDRAAQFAPFAALTGHGESIEETSKEHTESVLMDEMNEIFYEAE